MASSVISESKSNENNSVKQHEDEPDPKRRKLDDLVGFKLEKILNNNTVRKSICIQGTFHPEDAPAVIVLEKTAFAEDSLKTDNSQFFTAKSPLERIFQNDIYGDYKYFPDTSVNALKATIICPATKKHIEKYSAHNCYMIDETPEIYKDIVLPYLSEEQFDLKWVHNILEHKSESHRIVLEDSDPEIGFILLPDLKWSGDLDTLYLLAVSHKHGIKSIRDLTVDHLPLLRNIQTKSINAIQSKYGLTSHQLRIYLHYQPSFYHLHVHFTFIKHEAPGITSSRCHLLSNVISNIELRSDYYQKVTIPFIVTEPYGLFKKFQEKGILQLKDNGQNLQ